jgi:hypothetical protein
LGLEGEKSKPEAFKSKAAAPDAWPFSVHRLSVIIRRVADDQQKRPSSFVASRIIRVIAFTFVVIWLLYVLYADPTRGSVNMAVSRTYLSLSGLFILLVFAFMRLQAA